MRYKSGDFRDRGWAWMILVSSCVCQLLLSGPLYGAGYVAVVLKETFHANVAVTSLPGALVGCLTTLLGPFSSFMTSKFGYRVTVMIGGALFSVGLLVTAFSPNISVVVLGYGVLCGIGSGLFYTPAYVIVGYYFNQKRTFATGLSCSFMGPGLSIFPPLFEYLFYLYAWRGALIILAGITLHVCVAGALLRPIPQHGTINNEETKKKIELKHETNNKSTSYFTELCYQIRTGSFYCVVLSNLLVGAGISAVYMHLSNFSVANGFTFAQAGILTVIIGITMVSGRFIMPIIARFLSVSSLWMMFTCIALGAVATVTLPFYIRSSVGASVFASMFGLFTLSYASFISQLIVDFNGLRYLNTVYGVAMFGYGIGAILVPPITGALVDLTGVYDYCFYIAGIMMMLSALCLVPLPILRRRREATSGGQCEITINS